jgi:pimeloyl-ACP methyl ester carboxylesterase
MANDVVALLDHLSIRSAHVLGHSMGGRIALSMALNFPGRVKSLMLAATGSGPAARPGSDCIPGLPYRIVLELIEMGFERIAMKFAVPTLFSRKTFAIGFPNALKNFSDSLGQRTPSYQSSST